MQVKQLSSASAFSEAKLAKHTLFQTERFFLDVYCLEPQQSQKPHAHAEADKVYLVLEGRCRFTVDDDTAEHETGAAVFCPAGSEHGVVNPGPHRARLLVMMTPPPARP